MLALALPGKIDQVLPLVVYITPLIPSSTPIINTLPLLYASTGVPTEAIAFIATVFEIKPLAKSKENNLWKAVLPPPPIPQGGVSNIPGSSNPSEKLFDELEVVGIAGNQALLRTEERVYYIKSGEDLYLDGIKYRTTVEPARVRLGTEKSKDTFDDVLILTLGSAKSEKKESSASSTSTSSK